MVNHYSRFAARLVREEHAGFSFCSARGGTRDPVPIIAAQPRRLAAVSLAERVADELGMGAGGVGALCVTTGVTEGRHKTLLTFCTTGPYACWMAGRCRRLPFGVCKCRSSCTL